MNLNIESKNITQKVAALVLLLAIVLSTFSFQAQVASAASTGIGVNNSSLTVEKGLRVNFVVSAVLDSTTTTPGTFVFVSDNGGGDFYDGTTGGACNNATPDSDDHFSLNQNKGVCYSNATAGSYVVTAQLRNAVNGSSIGEPQTISVTVTEPEVLGCTDSDALNYNPAATSGNPDAEDCSYENPPEVSYPLSIEMCKFNQNEEPIVGWGMLLTNGEVQHQLTTGDEGCVVQEVDLLEGDWTVLEEDRAGYEQVSVSASEFLGEVVTVPDTNEAISACLFEVPQLQQARLAQEEGELTAVVVAPQAYCHFYNREVDRDEPAQCLDTVGTGANTVVASNQANLKNGNPITDTNRINASSTLGNPDWVVNGSTGFYSLGFGGSVTVKFDNFVNEVAGTDLSVHEATNGSYPLELATVEVSQNGSTWFAIQNASNTAASRVTELDFASTGLSWIKYVRLTDISNPSLHDALADGFDVDAVVAIKTTCSEPRPKVEPTGACEIEGHKYDNNGNPLAGWFIGLKKFVSYGEVEEAHVILNDTTDNQGYYCLEWDNVDFSEVEPGYDSFLYRIFEKLQSGWKFLSIEEGADYDSLAVVSEDDIWYGDNEVGTQFGKMNGIILASAEYHVDFYNATTSSTSTDGRYTLSVALSGEGEGSVTSGDALIACSSEGEVVDCSETYASGTVVTLTAVASPGSNFDNGWEVSFGTCTGNTTPCQVVMTQNVSLTAHFDLDDSSNGGNGGGGRRNSSSGRATPTVAGISDSEPQGLVLGDQVSVVPYGAANTGAGGTSQEENFPVVMILMTLIAVAVIASSTRRIFG